MKSGTYPPFMKPVDRKSDDCDKEGSVTKEIGSKHMSERQDIVELGEDLVAIDKALRTDTSSSPEPCRKWTEARTFSEDGKPTGMSGIVELEIATLLGINLSEDGKLVAMFRVSEPDEGGYTKFELSPFQLEASYPLAYDRLEEAIRENSIFCSVSDLTWVINFRLQGKPALMDLVKRYLKDGRRAAAEELAERVEEASDTFYAAKDDFGMF